MTKDNGYLKAIYLLSLSGHAKARPYSQPPLQHCNIFPGH